MSLFEWLFERRGAGRRRPGPVGSIGSPNDEPDPDPLPQPWLVYGLTLAGLVLFGLTTYAWLVEPLRSLSGQAWLMRLWLFGLYVWAGRGWVVRPRYDNVGWLGGWSTIRFGSATTSTGGWFS